MKSMLRWCVISSMGLLALTGCDPSAEPVSPSVATPPSHASQSLSFANGYPTLTYRAYVQNAGWQASVSDSVVAGTTGQALALQAFQATLSIATNPYAHICYRVEVGGTWQPEACDGATAGTPGQSTITSIRIYVKDAPEVSVCYQAHYAYTGWKLDWRCDGEVSTDVQGHELQALRVRLVKPFGAGTFTANLGQPNGFRLQSFTEFANSPGYDRAFVPIEFKGEDSHLRGMDQITQFCSNNAGHGLIYIIGDEPDHGYTNTGTGAMSPTTYARLFRQAVEAIRGLPGGTPGCDPTARFASAGFTPNGVAPAECPGGYSPGFQCHGAWYAELFANEYYRLSGNTEAPPVYEWRFNANGMGFDGVKAYLDDVVAWGQYHGFRVYLGSVDPPSTTDIPLIVQYVRNNSRITGGMWWAYDVPNTPTNLVDSQGALTGYGTTYYSAIR